MPFTAEEVSSVIHPVSVQPGSTMPPPSGITAHDLRIYKLGNLSYMELYCQYVPQESGLFLLWTPHSGYMEQVPLFETSEEELLRTPVETQMVLMNAEKYNIACKYKWIILRMTLSR